MSKLFSFLKSETSARLPKILENGTTILVPLCPDYVLGGISDGVSPLMSAALYAAEEIHCLYLKTFFVFLLADTEEDVLQGFNREPIFTSKGKLSSEIHRLGFSGTTLLFSQVFPEWHARQYDMEVRVRVELATNSNLTRFFYTYQEKRRERYSLQYGGGRRLSDEEVRALQVRHYAQYLLLREIMHEREELVLMNYQTENLRAITKTHSFQPERRRLELIVY